MCCLICHSWSCHVLSGPHDSSRTSLWFLLRVIKRIRLLWLIRLVSRLGDTGLDGWSDGTGSDDTPRLDFDVDPNGRELIVWIPIILIVFELNWSVWTTVWLSYYIWNDYFRLRRKFFSRGINLIIFCLFSFRFVQFFSLRIILLSSLLRDDRFYWIGHNFCKKKNIICDWLNDSSKILRSRSDISLRSFRSISIYLYNQWYF